MSLKILTLLAATLVLGGCAADNTFVHIDDAATLVFGHPDLPKFKGSAFFLRSVSTNYDHHWVDVSWKVLESRHCLPHGVYEAELRYDLLKGWRHEHLDRGTQPPVPVDVVIRVIEASHSATHANSIVTYIKLPGITIRTRGQGPQNAIYLPMWKTARFLIPTAAVQIIYSLHYLQVGKPGRLKGNGNILSSAWGGHILDWFAGHKYEIRNPMSEAEAEAATGKSAKELTALCDAGGGK
jgi:hypothetical protein